MGTAAQQKKLYTSILAVMGVVGYVEKGGKMDFGNVKYTYAGEGDLIRALRPVMLENQLFLVPSHTQHAHSCNGGQIIEVHYTLYHVDGGTISVGVAGMGQDKGDKAIPKAMTGALKYALRQLFLIETGDDPDKDASGKTAEEVEVAVQKRARVKAIEDLGRTVSDVAAFCRVKGKDKPLDMPAATFKNLIKFFSKKKGSEALDAFLGIDPQDSTSRASEAMK